jgi:hypothetical protein
MFTQVNQISQNIKTPAFLLQIIRNVESKIKRSVNDTEEDKIIDYITQYITNNNFTEIPIDKLIIMLTNIIIEKLHLLYGHENAIDIHEMLKENIGETIGLTPTEKDIKKIEQSSIKVNIGSIFGLDTMSEVIKKSKEPISSVNSAYFLLDSRYRILENDGTNYLKWGHINNLVRAQGTYNSIGNIRDIISIKIMKYKLPKVASAINAYNKITTLIYELCSQSCVAHEERRYHFMGDTKIIDNWIEVDSDDFSKGEFKFNKPITHLDSMTVTFGSPLTPVILDKDRLLGTITYDNPTIINFPEFHNISTNDIVYITNFTTLNLSYDSLEISGMNSVNGLVATVITPTSISIPVDTTKIITPISGVINPQKENLIGMVTVTENSINIVGIGTDFTVDFKINEYIFLETGTIHQIKTIVDSTHLILYNVYNGETCDYTYGVTNNSIFGVGTLFTSELSDGDVIIIMDGVSNTLYKIKKIQSNTELTLETSYNGLIGMGFNITKNNNNNKTISVFFGSKRVFLPIEITYLSAPN